MGMFGRRKQGPGPTGNLDAVAPLWQWWVDRGRALADEGPDGAEFDRFLAEIDEHLGAVHPGLSWEVGPGRSAARGLVVTPDGARSLRGTTERCVRAAPAADAGWEFFAARQPGPDLADATLAGGEGPDVDLSLATVTLSVDEDAAKVDVTVHHPAFDAWVDQQGDGPLQIAFHVVDLVLGEDAVMRWVGLVAASTDPGDALPADALAETVTALAERVGDDTWVTGEGKDGKYPVLFSARRPLTCLDQPLFDQHLLVQLPYAADRRTGFPDDADLAALEEWEDDLSQRLGERGRLLVRATSRGVRAFHLYCDHTDPGAGEMVREAVASWPRGDLQVTLDPGWGAVRRFG